MTKHQEPSHLKNISSTYILLIEIKYYSIHWFKWKRGNGEIINNTIQE